MRYDSDTFDDVIQADVDEIAPGMRAAIHKSLQAQFDVREVNIRTVLVAGDGFGTVRWSADCRDTIREDRRKTFRDVTVHGLSLVGRERERGPVVTHYIDWAGVMGQLGMTTSRPAAVDPQDDRTKA